MGGFGGSEKSWMSFGDILDESGKDFWMSFGMIFG